jgi:hypothetical protein
MIDDTILLKARSELGRLNQQLHELHLEEQRCQLKRGRLEAEKARVQSFVDTAELALRFQAEPSTAPAVSFVPVFEDQPNGPKFVVPSKPKPDAEREVPVASSPKYKPDGLPTYQQMVQTVLDNAAPKWLAPKQITAVIRQTWWPDVPRHKAASTAWGMARAGRLDSRGGRYRAKLNGHARDAAAEMQA